MGAGTQRVFRGHFPLKTIHFPATAQSCRCAGLPRGGDGKQKNSFWQLGSLLYHPSPTASENNETCERESREEVQEGAQRGAETDGA